MREYIRKLLLERLSYSDASRIFRNYGVDVSNMDTAQLHKAYRDLMLRYHPDHGGTVEDSQVINSAYDTLKKGKSTDIDAPQTSYSRRQPSGDMWSKSYEPWRWAGYSGGSPPSAHIGSPQDANYVKYKIWELSGEPAYSAKNDWTFHCWDGHYFRGIMSVLVTPEYMFKASELIAEWDRFFKTEAVFYEQATGVVRMINYKGHEVSPPIVLFHDSFNHNPGNDPQFVELLRNHLDDIYHNPKKY